jgi:hypothetical protein
MTVGVAGDAGWYPSRAGEAAGTALGAVWGLGVRTIV